MKFLGFRIYEMKYKIICNRNATYKNRNPRNPEILKIPKRIKQNTIFGYQ